MIFRYDVRNNLARFKSREESSLATEASLGMKGCSVSRAISRATLMLNETGEFFITSARFFVFRVASPI